MGPEIPGNGSGRPERFGGKYRSSRRDTVLTEVPTDGGLGGREAKGPALELAEARTAPLTLPSFDADPLTEPSFPPAAAWSGEQGQPSGSMVDHPLLRALLMELPPQGSVPPPGWLDRWFDATRAVLDLLYVPGAARSVR